MISKKAGEIMNFRHEVKHEINLSDMMIIRSRLKAVAYPDPHTIDEKYVIRSMYFDKLEDKIELLRKLSEEYNCQILLKGVIDVITSRDDYKLNRTGNQGMTIGGTGDLLAGIAVALATKNTLFEAAYLSSFILGQTADKVLEEKGFNYRIKDILKKL